MSNFKRVTFVGGHLDGTIQQVDIESPYFHTQYMIPIDPQAENMDNPPESTLMEFAVYDRNIIRAQEKFYYIYVICSMSLSEAITQILHYYGEKKK